MHGGDAGKRRLEVSPTSSQVHDFCGASAWAHYPKGATEYLNVSYGSGRGLIRLRMAIPAHLPKVDLSTVKSLIRQTLWARLMDASSQTTPMEICRNPASPPLTEAGLAAVLANEEEPPTLHARWLLTGGSDRDPATPGKGRARTGNEESVEEEGRETSSAAGSELVTNPPPLKRGRQTDPLEPGSASAYEQLTAALYAANAGQLPPEHALHLQEIIRFLKPQPSTVTPTKELDEAALSTPATAPPSDGPHQPQGGSPEVPSGRSSTGRTAAGTYAPPVSEPAAASTARRALPTTMDINRDAGTPSSAAGTDVTMLESQRAEQDGLSNITSLSPEHKARGPYAFAEVSENILKTCFEDPQNLPAYLSELPSIMGRWRGRRREDIPDWFYRLVKMAGEAFSPTVEEDIEAERRIRAEFGKYSTESQENQGGLIMARIVTRLVELIPTDASNLWPDAHPRNVIIRSITTKVTMKVQRDTGKCKMIAEPSDMEQALKKRLADIPDAPKMSYSEWMHFRNNARPQGLDENAVADCSAATYNVLWTKPQKNSTLQYCLRRGGWARATFIAPALPELILTRASSHALAEFFRRIGGYDGYRQDYAGIARLVDSLLRDQVRKNRAEDRGLPRLFAMHYANEIPPLDNALRHSSVLSQILCVQPRVVYPNSRATWAGIAPLPFAFLSDDILAALRYLNERPLVLRFGPWYELPLQFEPFSAFQSLKLVQTAPLDTVQLATADAGAAHLFPGVILPICEDMRWDISTGIRRDKHEKADKIRETYRSIGATSVSIMPSLANPEFVLIKADSATATALIVTFATKCRADREASELTVKILDGNPMLFPLVPIEAIDLMPAEETAAHLTAVLDSHVVDRQLREAEERADGAGESGLDETQQPTKVEDAGRPPFGGAGRADEARYGGMEPDQDAMERLRLSQSDWDHLQGSRRGSSRGRAFGISSRGGSLRGVANRPYSQSARGTPPMQPGEGRRMADRYGEPMGVEPQRAGSHPRWSEEGCTLSSNARRQGAASSLTDAWRRRSPSPDSHGAGAGWQESPRTPTTRTTHGSMYGREDERRRRIAAIEAELQQLKEQDWSYSIDESERAGPARARESDDPAEPYSKGPSSRTRWA